MRNKFAHRHRDVAGFWQSQFAKRTAGISAAQSLSAAQQLLVGAHLAMEYSLESAALFNPSIVWHPDQNGVPAGRKRFVISLRATGEGHISSLVFLDGIADSAGNITIGERSRHTETPEISPTADGYGAAFSPEIPLSGRVIFPQVPEESNGIEDARFVQWQQPGEPPQYFATYTAYDGHRIRSRLLETRDFLNFSSRTLHGAAVQNKNLALFPRKINGKYAMLSRQDNENNYIMFSDDLYCWETKALLNEPELSWEFTQLGNCGSPIETDAGWLVITHGVGAMRQYAISAMLLDRDAPQKIIGRLPQPLIAPDESEREGYVPNVVYSCGSIVFGEQLIVPYAQSDSSSSFATVNLAELIHEMS
ncbi:MAG: glycosidase [Calditrichae bacterium]|nr:glycosidase [Calditrichia bacterium]